MIEYSLRLCYLNLWIHYKHETTVKWYTWCFRHNVRSQLYYNSPSLFISYFDVKKHLWTCAGLFTGWLWRLKTTTIDHWINNNQRLKTTTTKYQLRSKPFLGFENPMSTVFLRKAIINAKILWVFFLFSLSNQDIM